VLKYFVTIDCTLGAIFKVRGTLMSRPLANSTNVISVTLVENNVRITDAVVSATVFKPDKIATTLPATPVPHVGNGVYTLSLPPSATPLAGSGYSVVLSITQGARVFNPRYYFNVYEG
jgi:hypothetical protein